MQIKIILNNNKSQLKGEVKYILKLRKHPLFAIKAKGAFYSPAFRRGSWDGYIRFISEAGVIDTGKIPQAIQVLKEFAKEAEEELDLRIVDDRDLIPKPSSKTVKLGGGVELREEQQEALDSILFNKIEDIPFPRGILFAATNFGKTILSAAIHKTYRAKTLFLLNSKELFNDALESMPKYLPGEVGILASGHKTEWNNFMIVMVQTAKARIKEVSNYLSQYPVVIVDEGDLATSPTYRTVISNTFNAYVKVALSGSPMVNKTKKEKNEKLRAIFGDIIFTMRNKELIEKNISADVICTFHKGSQVYKDLTIKKRKQKKVTFTDEYSNGVIRDQARNKRIARLVRDEVRRDRIPLLLITKNHEHVKRLYTRLTRASQIVGGTLFGLKIDWVHHSRPNRKAIVKRFQKGKLDILVGSYILKRGKNFPLTKSLIHGGAGDSLENILQIIGRITRKHKSRDTTYYHDFFDEGSYLKRHSKHRINIINEENLKLIKNY